ncbi:hypothetical protein PVAND_004864 [Polypedilum vanderplanki]|uniref:Solute carrier organic anion transporter family member n=1 Tax=Polypedilum vanderplanki TaxID=319348 RepID=A0A9J6BYI6_POLVA|nr:hypothetical protein PVAND_004864 [Polypedilum vanderplanki]
MENLIERKHISLEEYVSQLSDEALNGDFEEIYKCAPLSKEVICGLGSIRGRFLQKFANKKAFVLVFGVTGLIFASTHSYYNGIITTIEKRFKIPSKNIGLIATGNDITSLLLSTFIAYYVGKGQRPRWLALSILIVIVYCFINAAPHFVFGPGEEALSLTSEYGAVMDEEHSRELQENKDKRLLCRVNATTHETSCRKDEGDFMAQVFFFVAQLVAGIGQSLKHTLGISYLDDNILKSKTPALISFSYFIRLLGPAFGYALASFSLKVYIAPDHTPTITNQDPRWLGAWYIGWIVLGFALFLFVPLMAMFPKTLPRAAVRNQIAIEKKKRLMAKTLEVIEEKNDEKDKISFAGLIQTFKRLLTNKVFVLNNLASVFYVFGLQPFWTYTPKIMETLYHTSASASAFLTGTFGLTSSALGILTAGLVITKFKPSARKLTLWNMIIGMISALAVFSFAFMPCSENDRSVSLNFEATCNADCNCDYMKYSPVCGIDGKTYTSACHAGCMSLTKTNGTKIFESCSCVSGDKFLSKQATQGPCPVDCNSILIIFIAVKCLMKFLGASGRASNFLIGIRCIEKEDKAVALGFGMAFVRLLASVPSPIFFGYILDSACVVFGKTCSHKGNCWLYDNEHLRYTFNFIAAGCIFIGAIFDFGVWYYSKDLKIFDDDDDEEKKKDEK